MVNRPTGMVGGGGGGGTGGGARPPRDLPLRSHLDCLPVK